DGDGDGDDVDNNNTNNNNSSNNNNNVDSSHRTLQPTATAVAVATPKYKSPTHIPLPQTATPHALDSPSFHPPSHTLSHIAHSSIHTLLETNERLALDIRTLDSTMQTLVYENYSKFIDATDAIRSIGTNVTTAGNDGLDRLKLAVDRIKESSSRSERLLKESREAVAEKLRIQRLLVRLDALLCLPNTLRGLIEKGKFRTAVQSHGSATQILGRHSKGFESLRSIESECAVILHEMSADLKRRLLFWSGSGDGGAFGAYGRLGHYRSYDEGAGEEDVPLPPRTIAEIFECAGTLLMLHGTAFSPELDRSQCQKLALLACGHFLKERLDPTNSSSNPASETTSTPEKETTPISLSGAKSPMRKEDGIKEDSKVPSLEGIAAELPLSFLDGLLESTTLFGVSFPRDPSDVTSRELLGAFVKENFDKFIIHVKKILIRRSEPFNQSGDISNTGISDTNDTNNQNSKHKNIETRDTTHDEDEEEQESKEDANFLQISLALAHLLRSVRELASGLALPEVGLDVSLASTLVDQTVELTEMLVRRRVVVKFYGLREVVVKDCLGPLVRKVIKSGHSSQLDSEKDGNIAEGDDPDGGPSKTLAEMVQFANVALSDGLQMADDLIRATLQRSQLTGVNNAGVVAPVDSAVVKLAVQKNARLFGVWLATSLEQLVGCEPSDNNQVILEIIDDDSENDSRDNKKMIILPEMESDDDEFLSASPSPSFSRKDSVENIRKVEASRQLAKLVVQLDDEASDQAYSDFLLAICEMCRLAERSIATTLNQSIQSAMDQDSRLAESANTLFASSINPHRKGKDVLDADNVLAKRFQLAASRALAMYIMNRGAQAASELCANIYDLSDARDPYAIPSQPRDECCKLFELIKASCVDCISIVGGDLFVAPVAPFPDDDALYGDVFGNRLTQHPAGGGVSSSGAPRGLQLDVERMFIEKTPVLPHSLEELNFKRNSVVSGILRVALASFLECTRSSVFSSLGYRQMKVDAIFLRYLIPHFVKDEFGTADANACTCLFNTIDDIMLKAGQRCVDPEVVGDDEYYDAEKDEIVTPFAIVQHFLLTGGSYVADDDRGDDAGELLMKRISFS
ncbi:hypothetical protein ACHAXS_011234, partial [Conticribra weissflogii]